MLLDNNTAVYVRKMMDVLGLAFNIQAGTTIA